MSTKNEQNYFYFIYVQRGENIQQISYTVYSKIMLNKTQNWSKA